MIRLSRLADYAVVLMTHLAAKPERLSTAPELALATRVPAPTVSKILKVLAREGLLMSHRGARGGYTLARPAEQISIADIIGPFDGSVALTECIEDAPGDCGLEPSCPVRNHWRKINNAVRGALEELLLADMMTPWLPVVPVAARQKGMRVKAS
ncbi:MAG: SUF system Fe-S cluster assembly regulator [Alphaproteobacteria bacterium]